MPALFSREAGADHNARVGSGTVADLGRFAGIEFDNPRARRPIATLPAHLTGSRWLRSAAVRSQ